MPMANNWPPVTGTRSHAGHAATGRRRCTTSLAGAKCAKVRCPRQFLRYVRSEFDAYRWHRHGNGTQSDCSGQPQHVAIQEHQAFFVVAVIMSGHEDFRRQCTLGCQQAHRQLCSTSLTLDRRSTTKQSVISRRRPPPVPPDWTAPRLSPPPRTDLDVFLESFFDNNL